MAAILAAALLLAGCATVHCEDRSVSRLFMDRLDPVSEHHIRVMLDACEPTAP